MRSPADRPNMSRTSGRKAQRTGSGRGCSSSGSKGGGDIGKQSFTGNGGEQRHGCGGCFCGSDSGGDAAGSSGDRAKRPATSVVAAQVAEAARKPARFLHPTRTSQTQRASSFPCHDRAAWDDSATGPSIDYLCGAAAEVEATAEAAAAAATAVAVATAGDEVTNAAAALALGSLKIEKIER
ncbi:unnamed protein product [Phaeothamnion confervicola]